MARKAARPAGLDEFELIERYFRPLADDPAALNLTDDAAVLAGPRSGDLVLNTDTIVEAIHFLPDDDGADVAKKALRVNLSDLAAKGATARGYLLSLALPGSRGDEAWVRRFCRGLKSDQQRFGISLLGGDTVRSPQGLVITVTMIGEVPKGQAVLRSGARSGDALYVSGTLGDAALGLKLRYREIAAETAGRGASRLLRRYVRPEPRVELAPVLRRFAHAALDISDGLGADLGHLCRASEVSAKVDGRLLPLSAPARRLVRGTPALFTAIVSGGDDYEILAAIPSARSAAFEAAAREAGVGVTRIGEIERGRRQPVILGLDGSRLPDSHKGHTHFADRT